MAEFAVLFVILCVGVMIGGTATAISLQKTIQTQQDKVLDFDKIAQWKKAAEVLDVEADYLATWLSLSLVDDNLLPKDLVAMSKPQPDQIRDLAKLHIYEENNQ